MGAIKDFFSALLGGKKKSDNARAYIRSNSPLFSSFGQDIYASDIVKTAIHRIATEVSKCDVKSIIAKHTPRRMSIADDSINAVLSSWVNPICTLRDFLYKLTWQLLTNENAFIYWQFDEMPIVNSDLVKRVTRGFYLIQPNEVRIYLDGEEVRIELKSGESVFDMPYQDIVHIRNRYGANAILGGDSSGNLDAREMLNNLRTMHVIKESIPKTIEASLGIKGLLSLKTISKADKRKVSRQEFEQHLLDSQFGIVVTDYEGDFSPININPTDIPSNIMTFLRDEILAPWGVSVPIYIGKYTDDEFAAFYQVAIEHILIAISQGFTAVCFTDRERAFGHRIKVYDRLVQSLSFKARKEIVNMVIPSALLNRDEQRELLGFEPDGQPTVMSLNFIETDIAAEYQLESLKNKTKEDKNNAK